jgi:hypothetical protein
MSSQNLVGGMQQCASKEDGRKHRSIQAGKATKGQASGSQLLAHYIYMWWDASKGGFHHLPSKHHAAADNATVTPTGDRR